MNRTKDHPHSAKLGPLDTSVCPCCGNSLGHKWVSETLVRCGNWGCRLFFVPHPHDTDGRYWREKLVVNTD